MSTGAWGELRIEQTCWRPFMRRDVRHGRLLLPSGLAGPLRLGSEC